MGKLIAALIAALALVGMPLFAVLGAVSIVSWLTADNPSEQFVRFIAASVLTEKFADGKILITIPLFIFVGYLMAESKTPRRMVEAANAALGWLPGGLAIVCVMASGFFTTLTGGSGVTIVAIGGLLYPALVQQGYPRKFALGLVTTAGAMGLLFPPSPLVLIYGFVSGVDIGKAYVATTPPGLLLMLILCLYSVYVGIQSKVPRRPFRFFDVLAGMWLVKWEMLAPVLVLAGLVTSLMDLHESAAAAAFYTLIVEVYIYKDLSWRKVVRVARDAMSLGGAIIIILTMATAVTNYVVQQKIPTAILEWFLERGMSEAWQFILVMNLFLLILGMLMDAFSALLVALPLLIPLAAAFHLHPFYLAVMFLLNLEIAYVTPPVGLNLYIASYRFKRPIMEIYRVVVPFVGLLLVGLLIVILVPRLSDFTVDGAVAEARANAAACECKADDTPASVSCRANCKAPGNAPVEAWKLECIQYDMTNPLPCSEQDIAVWGKDGRRNPSIEAANAPGGPSAAGDGRDRESLDDIEDAFDEAWDDEPTAKPAVSAAPSASASAAAAPSAAPAASAAPPGGDADWEE